MAQMRRPLVLGVALVLAIAVTFVFGFRAGAHARRIRHQNDPVRPWMSVPYVAHSYRVPPHVLYEAIGIPLQSHDRRPIRDIAREQNRSVEEVIATLQNAIARERAHNPSGSQSPSPGRSP